MPPKKLHSNNTRGTFTAREENTNCNADGRKQPRGDSPPFPRTPSHSRPFPTCATKSAARETRVSRAFDATSNMLPLAVWPRNAGGPSSWPSLPPPQLSLPLPRRRFAPPAPPPPGLPTAAAALERASRASRFRWRALSSAPPSLPPPPPLSA